jgi:predicted transcriptional regulator
MPDRLVIRLDPERRRKLDELARSRHTSISGLVRVLVDRKYEEWLGIERVRSAQLIATLSAEDVPEPALLDQQLSGAYELPVC